MSIERRISTWNKKDSSKSIGKSRTQRLLSSSRFTQSAALPKILQCKCKSLRTHTMEAAVLLSLSMSHSSFALVFQAEQSAICLAEMFHVARINAKLHVAYKFDKPINYCD